jgi:predicted GNAT family N-acyltransferase
MTVHDMSIARTAKLVSKPPKPVSHLLGDLDILRLARGMVVFSPTGDQIDALVARARKDLPQIAESSVVRRVVSYNPDSLWAITRREHFDAGAPVGQGLLAFLMLNEEGLRQLVAGTFNAADPDLSLLTPQNEKPAGIYVWCCHARGGLAAGVPLAFQKVWTPLYQEADLYTRSINEPAIRFVEGMGFRREARYAGFIAPHLHVYRRSPQRRDEVPQYDSHSAGRDSCDLTVSVARSIEDMMRVTSVRAAVYMAEQECPYDEEFDGNDFTATHLLGFVNNEPAACIRLRWFADFAKVERLAVRKEFRQTRLAFHLVRAAIEFCRAKGYRRLYGHAQKRLTNFWSRFGFVPLENGQELVFSDFDYVEMVLDVPRDNDAITIGTDPYVTIRPEGRWHVPGVLEQSASRPVTRPSVQGASA